ncbi:hypothetical protein CONCODRAFT_11784 [Conidiobolus coronatus NRRL 28638]|uniref:Oxidoreductase-like domain-containing protein n=1 Tax=Conidiobolus coronatus (strain ATCC 28846 / CBS 209.66 / NRRL 28638) TaxID=796925 RepID=A0A137NUE8_CONC2|nr:hypothetical protein CONCODRAFT_11784 [Conidiobolus coronatus NRRL 28638]|eukprot:KXN66389.1 hypothetical protein CONCODRAFT_11784 [Conidiobolus coronatus NRRL 28638]
MKMPVKPEPYPTEMCCMSGCAVCIIDVYQEEFENYLKEKEKYIAYCKENGLEIPDIMLKQEKPDIDPSLVAFKEMEKKMG